MSTARTGARSDPPTVKIEPAKKDKYEAIYDRCWETDEYRLTSPGEKVVPDFITAAKPVKTQTLTDYGAGTGRGGYKLYKEHGLNVNLVDFSEGCLDANIAEEAKDNENLRFFKQDLRKKINPERIAPTSLGYCVDVMEHIPEDDVDAVLDNILEHSRNVFFQICCAPDHFGKHDHIRGDKAEETLHVCVHGYQWWLKKFVEKGVIIHRSADVRNECLFYVSAWNGMCVDSLKGYVNVSPEQIIKNIKHSATLGLPSIRPHPVQDLEVMLLAGGPSLSDFEDEIIQNRKDGMKLVTVNGSYGWAREKGLRPSLQFLIDAREFNARFTEQDELTDKTKFVISSSSDPSAFENLPDDRSYVFHISISDAVLEILEEEYGKLYEEVFPIPGGCTVTLRAIAALRMLGFYKIHIYGFDSCIREETHHAYKQEENDKDLEEAISVTIAGGTAYEKQFLATPWMLFQALDFKKMGLHLLDDVQLDIKGDGLIAHMVKAAAELSTMSIALDGFGVEIEKEPPGPRAYVSRDLKKRE
jgi:hypothetical protein